MRNYRTILIASFCLGWCLLQAGCDIEFGNWAKAKYEKTIERQAPLANGSTLVAQTSFGSVKVAGADVTDCTVVAEICGRAPTEEEAQELAEQVEIALETAGRTMTVKADKPHTGHNRSISISYTITVPRRTHLECGSSYGAIEIRNIVGNVRGKTSSGSITAENIEGSAGLHTSYGSVTCRHIAGDEVVATSSSGSITTEDVKGSTQLSTSYGQISCTDMREGDVRLKSSSGSIKLTNASFGVCDAQTSYGSVACENLTGDSVKLHSGSGSVKLTQAGADTMGLSTSYGRITCRQITTSDLTAKSGSGDLDIACPNSPADMTSDLVTSYGSISFSAPSGFSGRVDLSTSYGSVKTERPITISGEVSKKRLEGTIGSGTGKLHLQTGSGSINLM
ncbi:MAG: DUF4097 family beta strand repeat-containing protein [Sedimentisphaerales bacterium]